MTVVEYGDRSRETVILLHGGGLSWWNYRDAAKRLEDRFHVILPVLDGHADSDSGFVSIEKNADEIIDFIDRSCGGRVLLIGGLSLGGQILTEILSRRSDICRFAVIESASVVPMKLTNRMIAPVFGMSYGLIGRRWFAKLQFNSLHIRAALFEDYYRDTRKISKQDMISFLTASTAYTIKDGLKETEAEAHIFVGGRESAQMKKSARMLGDAIKGSSVRILDGFYHGDFSINHPDEYARLIRGLIFPDM